PHHANARRSILALLDTSPLSRHPILLGQLLYLVEAEVYGQNVRRLAFGPVTVCNRHKRAVRQQFHSRVSAVGAVVVVLEPDAVLAIASCVKILVPADPGDPIAP